ncbi:MAG: hypothetical protein ABSH16_01630 [Sedimentisphaerales bacterium]
MNKIYFILIVTFCLVCSLIIIANGSTTTTSTTTTTYWSTIDSTSTVSTTTTTSYSTIDTTSTNQTTTPPSPINVEMIDSFQNGLKHTVPSLPGSQRALIFIAFCESAGTATLNSVTYGGRPMTKIVQRSVGTPSQNYTVAFILNDANIAAATNDTFVVSWSAAPTEVEYTHVFLKNVSQSGPTGATSSNVATGTPNTITAPGLTSRSGDMVIAAADCGTRSTYTWNNYFTKRVQYQLPTSTATAATKKGAGISETASVSFYGPFNQQVLIGFVVRLSN